MLERRSLPFKKALRTIKVNRMAEGAIIATRGNQVSRRHHNKYDRFKIIAEENLYMKVPQHKVNTSLENLFTNI